LSSFCLRPWRHASSTLFPYTTLFRSRPDNRASDPVSEIDAALLAAVPIAKHLRGKILAERGLTASIGIASNKLLAKLASDFQKPDRKSTRLNSSHLRNSYAVFCLKKN